MTRDILYKLFEISGNEKDALVFLKNFRSLEPEKFALIHIDSVTFADYGESIIYDLRMLQRLGLFPIVLISHSILDYMEVFYKDLIDWENSNNEARLRPEILHLEELSKKKIQSIVLERKITFVVYENINYKEALENCLKELEVFKLIFLNSDSPFWDTDSNSPLSIINLQNDFFQLINSDVIKKESKQFLQEIKYFLERFLFLKSISITSPITLFKELFTIKGSGTYIKLGSNIQIIQNKEKISKEKLKILIESSFQKKIKEDFLLEDFDSIILESNYRGAAIMKKNEFGSLLSKFAVDEIARGEGIGREIWDKMKLTYSTIIWRANPKNPINKWYMKESEGMVKLTKWNVYWIGLPTAQIPAVCEFVSHLPVDFYE